MKSYGVIDIGTNSIRLLIAKTNKNKIIETNKYLEMTRLGKGVDKTKRISDESIDNTIKALKKFKAIACGEGIRSLKAIATSAVRDAVNREYFIAKAKKEVDIDIEVISGEREAKLGFLGVVNGIEDNVGEILVLDIGGGSTEFIVGNSNEIKYMKSVDVGAVRMTDKHINSDPVTHREFIEMDKDIKAIIKNVIGVVKNYNIEKVVGIGGTITTLGAVDQSLEKYDRNKIHNYILNQHNIQVMINNFKSIDNKERQRIKGLQPKRADIILAGSVILDNILKDLTQDNITISEYDNLEGYVFENLI